ncbi:hypothetical protein Tco_1016105 [Tanacetum coccineum]|uniref:Uncharacterized protein n=1 Tax=Tanacetum coccineum TaxID=301880 RepID=A0ABQ5FMP0_9ASTR
MLPLIREGTDLKAFYESVYSYSESTDSVLSSCFIHSVLEHSQKVDVNREGLDKDKFDRPKKIASCFLALGAGFATCYKDLFLAKSASCFLAACLVLVLQLATKSERVFRCCCSGRMLPEEVANVRHNALFRIYMWRTQWNAVAIQIHAHGPLHFVVDMLVRKTTNKLNNAETVSFQAVGISSMTYEPSNENILYADDIASYNGLASMEYFVVALLLEDFYNGQYFNMYNSLSSWVGDLGLARYQPDGDEGEATRVIGTFGYLASKVARSRKKLISEPA